jgi:NADH dehydrogenase [ubiquinone] 1 alpha subcomplex assembly factor 1
MLLKIIKPHLIYIMVCLAANNAAAQNILFDFEQPPQDSAAAWLLFSDAAMRGNSTAEFEVENNIATFSGVISLKNDGGIAQAISPEQNEDWQLYEGIILRVKGDGKDYILSLQRDPITEGGKHLEHRFATLKDAWTEVKIPFDSLENTYFDTYILSKPIKLDQVRYFTFINAYQEGQFALQIDWIKLY